jgi:teichoic acid transport system permease protein
MLVSGSVAKTKLRSTTTYDGYTHLVVIEKALKKRTKMINNIRHFINFIKDVYHSRRIIFQLARNDFKSRFAGSYLGIIWAFIQPIVMIGVLWFVFSVGFRTAPVADIPFILWLSCGLIPWFFFAEALNSATGSLLEYSYLVKKVVFRTSVLPLVKLLSAYFVHLFFLTLLVAMFLIYGYRPNIYYIQIIYYSFAQVMLLIGLSWATASLAVFIKDTAQMISVILQIGFWVTPILWPIDMVPARYQFIFKLNPMYYIVDGYRDTLIHGIWFWHRHNQGLYFWLITSALFFVGALLFKKLRPHFPDVL